MAAEAAARRPPAGAVPAQWPDPAAAASGGPDPSRDERHPRARPARMNIGFSTSVVQRGRSGVAQYVFALLRAFKAQATAHRFTLFVLEQDLPLFEFAAGRMDVI